MPKITRDYQEGICSLCGTETLVRLVLNKDKIASVCKTCLVDVKDLTINELLSRFGEDISLNAS